MIERNRNRGALKGGALVGVVVAAVIVVAAVYWFSREGEPQPLPDIETPTGEGLSDPRPLQRVAPAETEEERGDQARRVIEDLQAAPGGPDYADAHARAQVFAEQGRFADAQLLYFFAARGGYGPAALELARSYDPTTFDEVQSLMDAPDAFQAYRWYQEAERAGVEAASARLAQLRAWAEGAAGSGDQEAERLLLQWD